MPSFQLTETEHIERWTVADIRGMTDRRGAEFQPTFVKLIHRNGELMFVEVHGATFRAGRPTSVNYPVENGQVVPGSGLGAAPTWVDDLVDVSYETPLAVSATGPVVSGQHRLDPAVEEATSHTAVILAEAAAGEDTK
jgi:hypothetical protein